MYGKVLLAYRMCMIMVHSSNGQCMPFVLNGECWEMLQDAWTWHVSKVKMINVLWMTNAIEPWAYAKGIWNMCTKLWKANECMHGSNWLVLVNGISKVRSAHGKWFLLKLHDLSNGISFICISTHKILMHVMEIWMACWMKIVIVLCNVLYVDSSLR